MYMHDTVEALGTGLSELRQGLRNRVAFQLHGRNALKVQLVSEVLFGETSDSVREVAVLAVGRGLSPEAVREACRLAFIRVFG